MESLSRVIGLDDNLLRILCQLDFKLQQQKRARGVQSSHSFKDRYSIRLVYKSNMPTGKICLAIYSRFWKTLTHGTSEPRRDSHRQQTFSISFQEIKLDWPWISTAPLKGLVAGERRHSLSWSLCSAYRTTKKSNNVHAIILLACFQQSSAPGTSDLVGWI